MEITLLIILTVILFASVAIQIWTAFRVASNSSVDLGTAVKNELVKNREETASTAKLNREEHSQSFRQLNDALLHNMLKISASSEDRLDKFQNQLDMRVKSLQDDSNVRLEKLIESTGTNSKLLREEVTTIVQGLSKSMTDVINTLGEHQKSQLESIRRETLTSNTEMRNETRTAIKELNDSIMKSLTSVVETNQSQSRSIAESQSVLVASNQKKLDEIKTAVEARLKVLQDDNNKQLDQMRVTVDEKLHGTLEKRLGESFKLVSDRLEAVQRGLGEMQVLATGVGDLKKVLTNVKTRGTWGEVQLGAMLEQVLTREQYACNASPKDNGEKVEFAIKMPGKGNDIDSIVWLPIDSKFPMESYQRLCEAQDRADTAAVDEAIKSLEANIKKAAQDISAKYIYAPKTTDFAILFLPTEGLFAEVIRRPSLMDMIQREYRIVVAGPTTLWSILNSLQMGFQTLAIEKRSSEVWKLLAAVKTEWKAYGTVMERVQKNLKTVSNTIDDMNTRSRAVGKKLKDVEDLSCDNARFSFGVAAPELRVVEEADPDADIDNDIEEIIQALNSKN